MLGLLIVCAFSACMIIAQEAVTVEIGDTEETLAARVLEAEHRIYPAALAMVARGEVRVGAGGAVFRQV